MRAFSIILVIFSFAWGFYTPITSAETFPGIFSFAGCTGLDCSACNVVDIVNEGLIWLIGILFILFALLMAIAGVKLVTSGGNPGALSAAKDSFINAIIGLVIILSAWLIVDTIMRALVGDDGYIDNGGERSGWLFWSEVQCYTQIVSQYKEVDLYPGLVAVGPNSYLAYVYDSAKSCKNISSASFPSPEICRTALESVLRSPSVYVVRDCGGSPIGSPPSWNSKPVCGESVTPGGGKTLTLKGGGTVVVQSCAAGAADRASTNFMGKSVTVHKNLIPSLSRIDAEWSRRGGNSFYRVITMGSYDCRTTASGGPSNHAYGLAIDINSAANPHCPPWEICRGRNVLITDMEATRFYDLFKAEGWGWGGEWRSSKDAMHFSKATGERGDMVGE